MIPEFISFEFLAQDVPLWFALLMGYTAPYLWSRHIKQAAQSLLERYT